MNPALVAARAGLSRGRIELRQTLTTPHDLISILITIGGFLAAMIWTRHAHVPGTHFSLGTTTLVSVLGLDVVVYGFVRMGDLLVTEREDGTLLRAKAIPNGMLGYLLGKVVNISGQIAFVVAITLLTGAFLFTGLAIGSPGSWLTLAWVLALGLLATLPLGAVLGSMFDSQRSAGGPMLLLLAGLAVISGIFYPITHLPVFLQWAGQAFPMYWLGLGMRSALLPNAMAAVEVGHSWRHLATFGVLSAWAIAGLVLAPVVLRRMARRESGSNVAARREKAMRGI
jgi:ABC-2 type transport system permease protein